jgi:hypothetical protein
LYHYKFFKLYHKNTALRDKNYFLTHDRQVPITSEATRKRVRKETKRIILLSKSIRALYVTVVLLIQVKKKREDSPVFSKGEAGAVPVG